MRLEQIRPFGLGDGWLRGVRTDGGFQLPAISSQESSTACGASITSPADPSPVGCTSTLSLKTPSESFTREISRLFVALAIFGIAVIAALATARDDE